MHGTQLTFYTTQNLKLDGQSVTQWLTATARSLGVPGVTVVAAAEGYGHDGRFHSGHFFELADQPVLVVMVMSEAVAEQLLATIQQADVRLFYTRTAIAYGTAGLKQ